MRGVGMKPRGWLHSGIDSLMRHGGDIRDLFPAVHYSFGASAFSRSERAQPQHLATVFAQSSIIMVKSDAQDTRQPKEPAEVAEDVAPVRLIGRARRDVRLPLRVRPLSMLIGSLKYLDLDLDTEFLSRRALRL